MQRLVYAKIKKGFSTLTSVIILLFASVFIIVSTISGSTDTFIASSSTLASVEARALANSCAETAMNSLKINLAYAGSETFTFGNGSCSIQPVTGSGNTNRIIRTSGTVRGVTRETEMSVQTVNPTTVLNYWIELDL